MRGGGTRRSMVWVGGVPLATFSRSVDVPAVSRPMMSIFTFGRANIASHIP
jgi:hypothetical protein